jgi:hypothetical protein
MSEEEIREVSKTPQSALRHKIGIDETKTQALELDDIKTHRWKIIASSAVTGVGLKEGIDWVVRDAKERMFLF